MLLQRKDGMGKGKKVSKKKNKEIRKKPMFTHTEKTHNHTPHNHTLRTEPCRSYHYGRATAS